MDQHGTSGQDITMRFTGFRKFVYFGTYQVIVDNIAEQVKPEQ